MLASRMHPLVLHSLFEALAWILAIAIGWWARRRYFPAARLPMPGARYPLYLLFLWLGAVAGAYGLGSLNLATQRLADAAQPCRGKADALALGAGKRRRGHGTTS